jgi:sulfur carrier protein
MRVRVNGTDRELPDGATVADLLATLELRAAGVAVAVDGEVCVRTRHADTALSEGAEVEILTAVQGG